MVVFLLFGVLVCRRTSPKQKSTPPPSYGGHNMDCTGSERWMERALLWSVEKALHTHDERSLFFRNLTHAHTLSKDPFSLTYWGCSNKSPLSSDVSTIVTVTSVSIKRVSGFRIRTTHTRTHHYSHNVTQDNTTHENGFDSCFEFSLIVVDCCTNRD